MGATKKRRQTKHRGNAAGMVESRGRTGARANATTGSGGRGPRVPQPASWQRAFTKALLPVAILLPMLLFVFKDNQSVGQSLTLVAFAYVFYVPLSYYSDRWVYNRYLKRGV